MIGLIPLLLLNQSGPPELERIAAQLRLTGADVRVDKVDDPRWEIMYDFTGRMNDETLRPLKNIKRLVSVRIFSDDLTDERLKQIGNLPDLWLMVLMSTKLTDKCVDTVIKFPNLKKLDLNKFRLTKVGLGKLVSLKKLELLYLYNAKIDDSDLEPLFQLKQLKLLSLPKSVSPVGLSKLRRALPKTQVERSSD